MDLQHCLSNASNCSSSDSENDDDRLYDSDYDSDEDFEFPDELFAKAKATKDINIPSYKLERAKAFFNTEVRLLQESEEEKRVHVRAYMTRYLKIMSDGEDINSALQRLTAVERLTHYVPEFQTHFVQLYRRRKDPEVFKELQTLLSQWEIIKVFRNNYDIYMSHMDSLRDKSHLLHRKGVRLLMLASCCSTSKTRALLMGQTWELENAEEEIGKLNVFLTLNQQYPEFSTPIP